MSEFANMFTIVNESICCINDNLHNYFADILISGLQNSENPGASGGPQPPGPPQGRCPVPRWGPKAAPSPPAIFRFFFSKSILIPVYCFGGHQVHFWSCDWALIYVF